MFFLIQFSSCILNYGNVLIIFLCFLRCWLVHFTSFASSRLSIPLCTDKYLNGECCCVLYLEDANIMHELHIKHQKIPKYYVYLCCCGKEEQGDFRSTVGLLFSVKRISQAVTISHTNSVNHPSMHETKTRRKKEWVLKEKVVGWS